MCELLAGLCSFGGDSDDDSDGGGTDDGDGDAAGYRSQLLVVLTAVGNHVTIILSVV